MPRRIGSRPRATPRTSWVVWGLVFCAVVVRPGLARGSSPVSGDTLTILFTAETRGNLSPCSCPQDPVGGLARRVGFLNALAERRRSGGPTFVLDAGGFLPEGAVPLRDGPGMAARLVALLLRGFRRAGLSATALDHRQQDFLLAQAPAEAAALRDAFLDADPPGAPKLLAWGNRRLAVLALEETLPDTTVIHGGVSARSRADYLIVLARADAYSGRRLARLARADLVLLSRGARPPAPLEEGTSLLVGCGREGREVGELRLVVPQGSETTPRLQLADFALHPMNAAAPEDPEMARRVEELLRVAGPDAFVHARE